MHRDIKRELQRYSKSTLIEQQFAFDKWRHEFNHVRPHEYLKPEASRQILRKVRNML